MKGVRHSRRGTKRDGEGRKRRAEVGGVSAATSEDFRRGRGELRILLVRPRAFFPS